MKRHLVSVVRFDRDADSVRRAVELCQGLAGMPAMGRVFIKPNIVFWTKSVEFPKWGVITTSRVVEDTVRLLKDAGAKEICIGEGTVVMDPKDRDTAEDAFMRLGYRKLETRYGIKCINIFERPFVKKDLGDGIVLKFNRDILESDFVVNLPVLKTHAMTVVSLGIKNLKGVIDISSRKKCHSTQKGRDLDFMISRLFEPMPPMLTLIDGIYSSERGPNIDGKMHRSDILVASSDVLSADKVGAALLGYDPEKVPHLLHAITRWGRTADLSDVEVAGESVAELARPHEYDFAYNKDSTLPLPLEKMGIKGLSFRKYDLSLCTYCSGMMGPVLMAIAMAWKGRPWDDVEVLTGKSMAPTPGKKNTILFGKCIWQANRDNPDIQRKIPIKGCPPRAGQILKAFREAGIDLDPSVLLGIDRLPGLFMKKYEGRPGFDPSLFMVEQEG